MAFVRPIVRAALDRTGEPGAALERTNRILVGERRTGLFVTVLCGVLDLETGEARVAIAGHEPPILVPAGGGEPRWIEGGGPLLGAFERLDLDEVRVRLGAGDQLVTYTDGVTDAASPAGDRFGDARLLAAVRGTASPDDTVASVMHALGTFRQTAEPADDVALLVIGREG